MTIDEFRTIREKAESMVEEGRKLLREFVAASGYDSFVVESFDWQSRSDLLALENAGYRVGEEQEESGNDDLVGVGEKAFDAVSCFVAADKLLAPLRMSKGDEQ